MRLLLAPSEVLSAPAQRQPAASWLSPQELQRWQSLPDPERQAHFLACRYALRQVLATPQQPWETWRLRAPAGNPPAVDLPSPGAPWPAMPRAPYLSLSHSQHYVMAGAAPHALGVDVEVLPGKRRRHIAALAQAICSPCEQQHLAALPQAQQTEAFMQYWVLKEAYFKALGTGLDLQRIAHIHCQRIPHRDPQTTPLAYAWFWRAHDAQGCQVLLAVCALQPMEMPIWVCMPAHGLKLGTPQAWCLVEQDAGDATL